MKASDELWIFNHYAATPDQPAGTRHFDLARGLSTQGFRVTIFAADHMHNTATRHRVKGRALFERQIVDRVRFVWVRTVPYRGNSWMRLANMVSYAAVVLLAQRRFRRPGVVIGSTVHPFAAVSAYLAARLRGARFFLEIRDLWPQTLIDMGALRKESLSARLLWWLEGALVRRAELVITLLPGVSEYLEERRLPTDRILYLPNGVWIEESAPEERHPAIDVIDRLRAEGRFVFGYLGAHGRANGLHIVVAAAAELERTTDSAIQVVLIGDGPEKAGLSSAARIQHLRNVTFMDPVPKTVVPAVIRHLDAGILHLTDVDVFRYGISPNKLFDYMSNGRPVLFACRSGNDPVREAGAGMSVNPDDPSALAAAMRALANTPAGELDRMGGAGRRYVEAHHDLHRLATRLGEVVRSRPAPVPLSADHL